ncbi:tail fiber assembly protein [Citrobacter freundii]|nr:tail fiber assembly protein [Citrobacter freundii]
MKPVFDKNGLAIEAGNVRCYYYDDVTFEYMGWSDEYINPGVSMPGHSTDIDPGEEITGEIAVFIGDGWRQEEDHRGEVIYSTDNGTASTVDYIGSIPDGYTSIAPSTPYDTWNGEEWITDVDTQHTADVAEADVEKQSRINQTNAYMNSKQYPGKAALGRLTDNEKAQYNEWLDYLDALEAVDTASAPDINWPLPPAL